MKKLLSRTDRRRSGGQTLVETALVLSVILLPLTLGILQYGIVLNATNTLNQIAREGGRYAAVHGTEVNSDGAIKDYIQAVAAGTSIKASDLPDSAITISMVPSTASRVSGNPIRVSIVYPMKNKVFVGSILAGVTKLKTDYTAQSTFVLE